MVFSGIARALYDYAPTSEGETSLTEEEVVFILDASSDPDWTLVRGKDRDAPSGLVPASYLEQLTEDGHAVALYDYPGEHEEEVELREGERVSVFDRADRDWWIVGTQNGAYGVVPASYLEDEDAVVNGTGAGYQEQGQAAQEQEQYVSNVPVPSSEVPEKSKGLVPLATATDPAQEVASLRLFAAAEMDRKKKKTLRKGLLAVSDTHIYYMKDPKTLWNKWPLSDVTTLRDNQKTKKVKLDFTGGEERDFQVDKKELDAVLKLLQTNLLAVRQRPAAQPIAPRAPSPPPPAVPARAQNQAQPQAQPAYVPPPIVAARAPSPPPPSLPTRRAPTKPAVALYDYTPQTDEEVAISEGDKLVVLDDTDPDWWTVRGPHGEGIVPKTYVELGDGGKVEAVKTESPKERESDKPDPAKMRTWTDRSGSFRVDAELLQVIDGKAQLHKANGVKITVPLEKLSAEDATFVDHWRNGGSSPVASSAAAVPPPPPPPPPPAMPARPVPAAPSLPDRRPAPASQDQGNKLSPQEIEEMDDRLAQELQREEVAALAAARAARELTRSDEELARQLQEEEDRRAAAALGMRPSASNQSVNSSNASNANSAYQSVDVSAVLAGPQAVIAPTALSGKTAPGSRSATISRRATSSNKAPAISAEAFRDLQQRAVSANQPSQPAPPGSPTRGLISSNSSASLRRPEPGVQAVHVGQAVPAAALEMGDDWTSAATAAPILPSALPANDPWAVPGSEPPVVAQQPAPPKPVQGQASRTVSGSTAGSSVSPRPAAQPSPAKPPMPMPNAAAFQAANAGPAPSTPPVQAAPLYTAPPTVQAAPLYTPPPIIQPQGPPPPMPPAATKPVAGGALPPPLIPTPAAGPHNTFVPTGSARPPAPPAAGALAAPPPFPGSSAPPPMPPLSTKPVGPAPLPSSFGATGALGSTGLGSTGSLGPGALGQPMPPAMPSGPGALGSMPRGMPPPAGGSALPPVSTPFLPMPAAPPAAPSASPFGSAAVPSASPFGPPSLASSARPSTTSVVSSLGYPGTAAPSPPTFSPPLGSVPMQPTMGLPPSSTMPRPSSLGIPGAPTGMPTMTGMPPAMAGLASMPGSTSSGLTSTGMPKPMVPVPHGMPSSATPFSAPTTGGMSGMSGMGAGTAGLSSLPTSSMASLAASQPGSNSNTLTSYQRSMMSNPMSGQPSFGSIGSLNEPSSMPGGMNMNMSSRPPVPMAGVSGMPGMPSSGGATPFGSSMQAGSMTPQAGNTGLGIQGSGMSAMGTPGIYNTPSMPSSNLQGGAGGFGGQQQQQQPQTSSMMSTGGFGPSGFGGQQSQPQQHQQPMQPSQNVMGSTMGHSRPGSMSGPAQMGGMQGMQGQMGMQGPSSGFNSQQQQMGGNMTMGNMVPSSGFGGQQQQQQNQQQSQMGGGMNMNNMNMQSGPSSMMQTPMMPSSGMSSGMNQMPMQQGIGTPNRSSPQQQQQQQQQGGMGMNMNQGGMMSNQGMNNQQGGMNQQQPMNMNQGQMNMNQGQMNQMGGQQMGNQAMGMSQMGGQGMGTPMNQGMGGQNNMGTPMMGNQMGGQMGNQMSNQMGGQMGQMGGSNQMGGNQMGGNQMGGQMGSNQMGSNQMSGQMGGMPMSISISLNPQQGGLTIGLPMNQQQQQQQGGGYGYH